MSLTARRSAVIAGLVVVAACVFLTGINWGLPSRAVDRFLFGDEPVWSGEKIAKLAPSDANTLGADIDANPLAKRSYPIVLNDTDEKRAEIIRRYRLFSHQPDEMITFKALARIKQHRGDPRLYQYGGLWIYPVGAMLKAASIVGLIELRGGPEGQAYYLDHPEAFGRFYIVARLYSVMWGLIGVWAVFWIVHRLSGSEFAAAVGALCYTFMPVVVTMAHEAKPHLPGAVLMLLSIIAAAKYVETGKRQWWMVTGALCGAAFGMVLSSLVGFVVIAVMVLLRQDAWPHRLRVALGATAIGLTVYCISNPYVVINLAAAPEILRSNLSNSTAMYGNRGLRGSGSALKLLARATSPILFSMGALGFAWVIQHRRNVHPIAWLLFVPAVLVLVQFVLLAEGKPAEYARFAIVPAAVVAIGAGVAINWFTRPVGRMSLSALAAGATAIWGAAYVRAFVADSSIENTRTSAAATLATDGGDVVVTAEPAPYSAPPVNLFERRLLLVRGSGEGFSGWTVRAVDDDQRLLGTSISWANKPFDVRWK